MTDPTPRAEGLREALAARPKNGERIYVEEDDYVSGWGDAMSHVRAALAASDTAPGLDVAEVADAFLTARIGVPSDAGNLAAMFVAAWNDNALAARLASPDPTGTPTEYASPSIQTPK